MNLEHLKENAEKYVYELRKFFPAGESPITHYVCENNVVVISTKRLYIFYFGVIIDYERDALSNIDMSNINMDNYSCDILLNKINYHLKFTSRGDLESLVEYYKKYKDE